MLTDQVEVIADNGHRAAQAGALTSVVSWLTSSEAGVVIGILLGLIGLAVQWYYRRKQDQRAEDLQQLKIKLIQDGYEARAALLEDGANE